MPETTKFLHEIPHLYEEKFFLPISGILYIERFFLREVFYMSYSLAVSAYENYLLGTTDKLILPGETMNQKDKEAKQCVRYAVGSLLEWSVEDAMYHMTNQIMQMLKLDMIIEKYVSLPPDCNRTLDLDYVMAVCFGIPVNRARMLERYQRRIKDGELNRFPKELFSGKEGRMNAAVILSDYINHNISVTGTHKEQIEQLYEKFGDSAQMNAVFASKGLYYVCHGLYNTPLEYFHYSLKEEDRDDFLFGVYDFLNIYKRTQSSMSASKKKKRREQREEQIIVEEQEEEQEETFE